MSRTRRPAPASMPICSGRPVIDTSPTFAMLPLTDGVMLGLWSRKTVEPAATAPGRRRRSRVHGRGCRRRQRNVCRLEDGADCRSCRSPCKWISATPSWPPIPTAIACACSCRVPHEQELGRRGFGRACPSRPQQAGSCRSVTARPHRSGASIPATAWCITRRPTSFRGKDRLQSFTAIGVVRDDAPIRRIWAAAFVRSAVTSTGARREETPIKPLVGRLQFTTREANWGFQLRFGLFEISGARHGDDCGSDGRIVRARRGGR